MNRLTIFGVVLASILLWIAVIELMLIVGKGFAICVLIAAIITALVCFVNKLVSKVKGFINV